MLKWGQENRTPLGGIHTVNTHAGNPPGVVRIKVMQVHHHGPDTHRDVVCANTHGDVLCVMWSELWFGAIR